MQRPRSRVLEANPVESGLKGFLEVKHGAAILPNIRSTSRGGSVGLSVLAVIRDNERAKQARLYYSLLVVYRSNFARTVLDKYRFRS